MAPRKGKKQRRRLWGKAAVSRGWGRRGSVNSSKKMFLKNRTKIKRNEPIPWSFNVRCARPWKGKNRKKEQKEEEKKVIKGTGRKKALSQRWTEVCDRHPGADLDVRVQIKGKKREREIERKRERANSNRKNKQTLFEWGVGGLEKKAFSFGATPEGYCSHKCFFFLWSTYGTHRETVWQKRFELDSSSLTVLKS